MSWNHIEKIHLQGKLLFMHIKYGRKKYILYVTVSFDEIINHKNIFLFSLFLTKIFVKLFLYINKTIIK